MPVVEQELQLQRRLVQMGGGQGLRALAQGGPGDRQGINRIGLAGDALCATAFAHQLRRDPDHPLSGRDQEALERAGDVAAVLDRPDPLGVELPPPGKQLCESWFLAATVNSPAS